MFMFLVVFVWYVLVIGEAQQREDFADIRLVGGPADAPNSGNVEVQLKQTSIWLNVCDNNFWGLNDGMVACRQLGFPGIAQIRRGSYFGEGKNNGSVGGLGCSGDENNLGQCDHQPVKESIGCVGKIGAAGLVCTVPGYLGCYNDVRSARVFNYDTVLISNDLTVDLCLDYCQEQHMRYAGLENKRQCYCGDEDTDIDIHGQRRDRDCNIECSGNKDEVCGGRMTLSIYDLTIGLCEGPETPRNGGRIPNAGLFRYGSNITFFCNEGYYLIGAYSARCILGDSPQTAKWDEVTPICTLIFDEALSTTRDPVESDGIGGIGTGATVGIMVVGIVFFLLFVILVLFIIRQRRSQVDRGASGNTQVQLENIYSEPVDPRHHTSPVRTSISNKYQDLDMSTITTDADKPYTSLRKEDTTKRASAEVDIPEYLEIYDSMGDAVFSLCKR